MLHLVFKSPQSPGLWQFLSPLVFFYFFPLFFFSWPWHFWGILVGHFLGYLNVADDFLWLDEVVDLGKFIRTTRSPSHPIVSGHWWDQHVLLLVMLTFIAWPYRVTTFPFPYPWIRWDSMTEPGGLPSMGSHRVGHDWSDLAAAAQSPPHTQGDRR